MKKIIFFLSPIFLLAISCATHRQHQAHSHQHQAGCGHVAVIHDGHLDYLHDGHLHNAHAGHVDDHVIQVSAANPNQCAPVSKKIEHKHGANCGHAAVPHAGHVDYLVDGKLHHPHSSHCDDHGQLALK